MAEAPGPSGESQGHSATQPPAKKTVGGPPSCRRRSVLRVSQLVLRAIAAHKGLTLATLRKEFGNAGYEVRRKSGGHKVPRREATGTLLRVSGSDAAGYFRDEAGTTAADRRGRAAKEHTRLKSGQDKRRSSKPREEKQKPKKPAQRTIQKPTPAETDRTSSRQGKTPLDFLKDHP
ncbi:hypothetical protein P7K49_019904 [Saguinus oedipus]|uniref:Testis-specific H1 histone n=1 Tax=Saguinus oedipus TaxID=9490 RepID=A0ABQ9UZ05_SAGOE|nr:hypothetical protein P7K49_019904 [Saguinus oedipus]